MRAALLQAMARDPNGRFDSAQAFGNAIRNSVATIGGPASPTDLARLLSADFADEMSSRDEILKAADDQPIPSTPPPIPPRASKPATRPPPIPHARSGELAEMRPRYGSEVVSPVPSMIVQDAGSSRVSVPSIAMLATPQQTAQLPNGGVLDLSTAVPVDTWMANPDTDLLRAHRWKSVLGIVLAIVAVSGIAVALLVGMKCRESDVADQPIVNAPKPDAAPPRPPPDAMTIDAVNKDDIVALSRFGFFSVDATARTTIYIDGKNIGETPLKRLPILPGPHTVKAVGPRGKTKTFKITVYGGRDTEADTITW